LHFVAIQEKQLEFYEQKLLKLVSDLNQEFERREKERGSQQSPEAEASDTADPGAGIPEDCT